MNPSFIFSFLLLVFFVIRTIRNIFYQLYIWQLKEYRFDRMLIHLRTGQGKRWMWGKQALGKWVLLLLTVPAMVRYQNILLLVLLNISIFLLYLLEALRNIEELIFDPKLPRFTYKATLIIIVTLSIQIGLALISPFFPLNLLLLDKMLPLMVSLSVLILGLPAAFYRKYLISRAIWKRQQYPNLKVIGITGSYGKTSTKEFLTDILKTKYNLLKTADTDNTDIAAAKLILTKLDAKTQILVVEMAAYKKGEIRDICKIVFPQIGIVTAINEQHLELFGSIENTMKTKFELIESLPEDGIAIFNADNDYCQRMADWAKTRNLRTLLYSQDIRKREKVDILATDIRSHKSEISFRVEGKGISGQFKSALFGCQNVPNILAAILTALNLGVKLDDIQKAVFRFKPFRQTMEKKIGPGGVTLIDDTFNTNPEAILAALKYMELYRGRKILVIQPMIELGNLALKAHEKIGFRAAQVCDYIFLTNSNFYSSLVCGVQQAKADPSKLAVLPTSELVSRIKKTVGKNDIVVFEGKEAAKTLKKLLG